MRIKLELIESTNTAFKDKQEAIRRRTTCQCNACRNILSLDLKFMAHYGDYIVQSMGLSQKGETALPNLKGM